MWPTATLGELCVQDRKQISATENELNGLPFIGLEQVASETGEISREAGSRTGEGKSSSFCFDTRHVLYGKLRPYLNKVALPTFEGRCSTELIPLLPTSHIERSYLALLLRRKETINAVMAANTGSRMPRADMKVLLSLRVPLPPLPEQRRIVDILNRANGIRRLRRETLEKAQQVVPALFVEMFGDPVTNPRQWPQVPLGQIAEVSYGLSDKLDRQIGAGDGTRILTISNIKLDGSIDFSVERYHRADDKAAAKARLQVDDLLFNWRNGSADHIGKTAIVPSVANKWLHVSFLLKVRPDRSRFAPTYGWVLLNQLRAKGYFRGQSRMQVNRKFNASELSSLNVALPPIELQNTFATPVLDLQSIIAQQERAAAAADRLVNSLMAQVFG